VRKLLAVLFVALAGVARAESVSVVIMDATGASEDLQRKVARNAEIALRELSGLQVKELKSRPALRKGCASEPTCLSNSASAAGTEHVLLLSLSQAAERLFLDGFLVDVQARKAVHRQLPEGRADEPEVSVKALVEALLPAFARKGWGGLTLKVEPQAQVKIDGARYALNPQDPFVALTAGTHEVDVLLPTGAALLQRKQVREGERDLLSIPSSAMFPTGVETSRGRSDALLATSYGLFAAGALTIASAFIVGAMARSTARSVTPCVGGQACTPFLEAQEVQQRAELLTRNANILLGAGAALSTAGAGVFVFDLVRSKESR
jgi:hypothetical protein